MSGLLSFIATVVEFLFKVVVTIISTILLVFSFIDIYQWPGTFSGLPTACRDGLQSYWLFCASSFATLWFDVATTFALCPTLLSWRGPFMVYAACQSIGKGNTNDYGFHYNRIPRVTVWKNLGLLVLDIPTLFTFVLGALCFWRLPFLVMGVKRNMSMKNWQENACPNWRGLGITNLFIGIFDIVTVLFFIVGLFNPVRLALFTVPGVFEILQKQKSLIFSQDDFLPEARIKIIAGGLRGVLEVICFLLFAPCLLFPWRWKDVHQSLLQTAPRETPSTAGKAADPHRVAAAESRKLHKVQWYAAGPLNFFLGIGDFLIFLLSVVPLLSWRCPTLLRAIKGQQENYAHKDGNIIRYNWGARAVALLHFAKVVLDIPFILMAFFTLVSLLRAPALVRRLRLVASDPRESGHHKESWMYANYRRPIATEFFKALVYILLLPLFALLLLTVYRIPALKSDLHEERNRVRQSYNKRRTTRAVAKALAGTSEHQAYPLEEPLGVGVAVSVGPAGTAAPSQIQMRELEAGADVSPNPAEPEATMPQEATSTKQIAHVDEEGELEPADERRMSDELFLHSLITIAQHCGLLFLDIPCVIMSVITFFFLIRGAKLFRTLTNIPKEYKRQPAHYRRKAAVVNFVLTFRDWFFILVAPLVLLSPPRFIGIFAVLWTRLQRRPDPTPLVHLLEVVPRFVHGQGWQLKVKFVKPLNLHISDAQIDFRGEAFWKSFSTNLSSVIALTAGTMMPYELTPKYLDLEQVNVASNVVEVLIDLRASIKRRTIIKKLRLLDLHAPVEIVLTCDGRRRTLFALETSVGTLLDCEEAGIPLPLTGLRPSTGDLVALAARFGTLQDGHTDDAAAAACVSPEVSADVTVDSFAPYLCDFLWRVVVMQLAEALMDWLAFICFAFAHFVPFRAFSMYKDLFFSKESQGNKAASEIVQHHVRTIRRLNGADHLGIARKEAVHIESEVAKCRLKSTPKSSSWTLEKSGDIINPLCPELMAFKMQTSDSCDAVQHSAAEKGAAAQNVMKLYLANILIYSLSQLRAVSEHRKILLGGEAERQTVFVPAASVAGAASQLLAGVRGKLRAAGLTASGATASVPMADGLAEGSSLDDDAAAAATQNRSRQKHHRMAFGVGFDEEEVIIRREQEAIQQRRVTALPFDEHEPASAVDEMADKLKTDVLKLVADVDPEMVKGFLLSVEFFDELGRNSAGPDLESFLKVQEDILEYSTSTLIPMLQQVAVGMPCCAAIANKAHSWADMRKICWYHALMVIPDLFVFAAVLFILLTVYRAVPMFMMIYKHRNWRRRVPIILAEMLIDFVFLVIWFADVIMLRYAVDVNVMLLVTIFRHRSYYHCRRVIWRYFQESIADLRDLASIFATFKIIKYAIGVVLVGIVTPAELVSHNMRGRVCGCEAWPFVLISTLIYYAFPFVIVYQGATHSSLYTPVLYIYGGCIAALLLLAAGLLLRRGVQEKRNTACREETVATVSMEPVTISHLPLTTTTVVAFLLILFEGYQLCSLSLGLVPTWGDGFKWITSASRWATLSFYSVGGQAFPLGYWLSLGFCFMFFVIISAPLVVNDVFKNSKVAITSQRAWQVGAFILGPVLALTITANLVAFSVCSDAEMRTFNVTNASTDSGGKNGPDGKNVTEAPSWNVNVTTVEREVRFMQVGSNPNTQLCWISNDQKAYGAIALILVVYYAPTAALRATRWSEPIRGASLRFHELYNSLTLIVHVVLGALWGFLHARQPQAFCIIQACISLILLAYTWKNSSGLLPIPRNCTSTVINSLRASMYFSVLLATVVSFFALRLDSSDVIDSGKLAGILFGTSGVLAAAISLIRITFCSAPTSEESFDGSLTALLDDVAQFESMMASSGKLVSWTGRDRNLFGKRLRRVMTSSELGDVILELERHLSIVAMRRLFFRIRNEWVAQVHALQFRHMNRQTLFRFEEAFQALKNGTTLSPESLHAAQRTADANGPHREFSDAEAYVADARSAAEVERHNSPSIEDL